MRRAGGGSKSRWPAMLVVKGVILAEWSNSGVGSGLLWKIEIGEKKTQRRWLEESLRERGRGKNIDLFQ